GPSRLEVYGKHVVEDVAGYLLLVVVIKRLLHLLEDGEIIVAHQRFHEAIRYGFAQLLVPPGEEGDQLGHVDHPVLADVGGIEIAEDLDGIPAGKTGNPLMFRFSDDFTPSLGVKPLAVLLPQPGRNVAGVELHFQQLQVRIAVKLVFCRVAYPLQQRLGAPCHTCRNYDPGKVVQHPRQENFVNMLAEDVPVDIDLGIKIHDVGGVDEFDPVGERLEPLDRLLVFRVHQGDDEGLDVFLQVLDLVNPFADDVVQLQQPLRIVRLDIHQRIDAVVGLGKTGVEIMHLVAVTKNCIDLPLQQFIREDVLSHRPVPGVENSNPLSQPAIELVAAGMYHTENFPCRRQSMKEGMKDGAAD